MFKSLHKALRRNGNKAEKARHHQSNRKSSELVHSTASSTTTSSSPPLTPTGPVIHDTRGIFRTLEPVWYYCNADDHWVAFEQPAQVVIEKSYHRNKPAVTLEEPAMTLHFNSDNRAGKENKWVLDKTIRRIVMPVWWYEQDSIVDGSKGMCRFDYKNQVRLEALSSDDEVCTQLTLSDEAFPEVFTVTLDYSTGRDLKEAWRGFLHLEVPVVPQYYFSYDAKEDDYLELQSLEDGTGLSRRFSI